MEILNSLCVLKLYTKTVHYQVSLIAPFFKPRIAPKAVFSGRISDRADLYAPKVKIRSGKTACLQATVYGFKTLSRGLDRGMENA